MRQIRTSGSMSWDRKRSGAFVATAPILDSTYAQDDAESLIVSHLLTPWATVCRPLRGLDLSHELLGQETRKSNLPFPAARFPSRFRQPNGHP